jgi:N-acetyl-anhydromuramyl-L-alanine amidase AmpD
MAAVDHARRPREPHRPADLDFEATAAVVTAFQRHFRPAAVDGRADRSTVEALRALLATRDGKLA